MSSSPFGGAILLALVIGVGGLAYFFLHGSGGPAAVNQAQDITFVASDTPPSDGPIDATVISTPAPPPPGYVEYRNDKYHFSFYHSPEGKITEYDEGGGAMTITLENLQKVRAMQIFIVPYAESRVTEARFKEDEPSGVRTNVENTTIDGVPAVTFNSTAPGLGDTREIWFIRGGYLYEVTTLAGVKNWFDPIISTWKFI